MVNAEIFLSSSRRQGAKRLYDEAFLHANDMAYQWLVGKASDATRRGRVDEAIAQVVAAAGFAANFHAGRFADGAIENIALDIGLQADEKCSPEFVLPGARAGTVAKRHVLHVASHMVSISGTARMLHRWVRRDETSIHSLVLTMQGELQLPRWLIDSIESSGGKIVSLPFGLTPLEKALCLRKAARSHADLVILHHGSHDIVPTMAFAKKDGPPVAVLNHADHLFWLGSSVTDVVINLRSKACLHTRIRRFIENNLVLPVPLDAPEDVGSKAMARAALGIPADQPMLLSIGRGLKYRPCGSFDFVATANKILDRIPGGHVYVVGESVEGIKPYLRAPLHDRLHFVGQAEDPSLFRAAADVYLESFPFGSQTALLESALMALPVVPAYAPLFELLVAQDDAIDGFMPVPACEEEYVERAAALVNSPEEAKSFGNELRDRLVKAHVGSGWDECLQAVYEFTDALGHEPAAVPVSDAIHSRADICLSHWHAQPDARYSAVLSLGNTNVAAALQGGYVSRHIGNMAACRRYAWQALCQQPTARASWQLVALSLLGPSVHRLRRMLQPRP